MPSDPPPSQVDGLPEPPKAFRVFAIAVNEGPPEKMLKEFDRLYEAKAFMRFLEKGGAFTQVRVEKVQVEAKAAPWKTGSRERKYGSKPGGLTKLIFFIGLLLSLGGGLVLGIFLASTLELPGRLFLYCVAGCTIATAIPAYWIMHKLYGSP